MNELNEALKLFEWRSIEDAPRDGTEIILLAEDGNYPNEPWVVSGFADDGDPESHKPGRFKPIALEFGNDDPEYDTCLIFTKWLPRPSFDRPDPRSEALIIAWQGLQCSDESTCGGFAGYCQNCRTREKIIEALSQSESY